MTTPSERLQTGAGEQATDPPAPLRKGDTAVFSPDRTAFEGRTVARYGSLVVFVDGAVPGDTVRAYVYAKKRRYAEARVVDVLEAGAHRRVPECRHFGPCGGCVWQHLDYDEQCRWKREHVCEAFERLGGFAGAAVRDIVPAAERWYYRNKMEFSFGEKRWIPEDEWNESARRQEPPFALGLHVPGRFDRVITVDDCRLQSPESNAILRATRDFFVARDVAAYSYRTHAGTLRHLVVREGKRTGERMVFLVTAAMDATLVSGYAAVLRESALGVTTFVHGVTERPSNVAVAERETVVFGEGRIRDRIGAATYTLSPTSFFQTNTLQAERLYDVVADAASFGGDERVWDLYCGAGTISLFVAPLVGSVLGVESHERAVRDAEENARQNGIPNVRFLADDAAAFLERSGAEGETPDVLIVDPPRAGLHPAASRAIAGSDVRRLVYVSCNPATCARDCRVFADAGFALDRITPVDMFPHTSHIECVIRLAR